jgi:hypothetical protein
VPTIGNPSFVAPGFGKLLEWHVFLTCFYSPRFIFVAKDKSHHQKSKDIIANG